MTEVDSFSDFYKWHRYRYYNQVIEMHDANAAVYAAMLKVQKFWSGGKYLIYVYPVK